MTTAKIADSAVTSAKIADGTIVNGDISSSAAIAYSKLSGVASSDHVHSWTTAKTYDSTNKAITLRINEKTRLAHVYIKFVTTVAYTKGELVPITSNLWLSPTLPIVKTYGATTHSATYFVDTDYEITLKFLADYNKGITVMGSILFPY